MWWLACGRTCVRVGAVSLRLYYFKLYDNRVIFDPAQSRCQSTSRRSRTSPAQLHTDGVSETPRAHVPAQAQARPETRDRSPHARHPARGTVTILVSTLGKKKRPPGRCGPCVQHSRSAVHASRGVRDRAAQRTGARRGHNPSGHDVRSRSVRRAARLSLSSNCGSLNRAASWPRQTPPRPSRARASHHRHRPPMP